MVIVMICRWWSAGGASGFGGGPVGSVGSVVCWWAGGFSGGRVGSVGSVVGRWGRLVRWSAGGAGVFGGRQVV